MEAHSVAEVVRAARSRGIEVYTDEPADASSVRTLEERIGHPLPLSVRAYLQEFGRVSVGDLHLSGIVGNDPCTDAGGGILSDTTQLRATHPSLPESHWVVLAHEDGAYCLDYSACPEGEPRVVNFERGASTPVAPSFSQFVADYLRVLAT